MLRRCRADRKQPDLANRVLDRMPGGRSAALYARVHLVRGDNGTPCLMELELTEPQLYFGLVPRAAERFARALAQRLVPAESGAVSGPDAASNPTWAA